MIWRVPPIWAGGEVWILGGGPSVTQQFDIPSRVVNDVISGKALPSVYSPYMEALHNRHVIGINVAYLIGNWIDMIFFGDHPFFLRYHESLVHHTGIKISSHPQMAKIPWVKFLQGDPQHRFGISSNPAMVAWNGNSGAAAVSVAANAGAKRIILLGFDMDILQTNKMQHWHDLYGKGPVVDNDQRRISKLPFEKHKRGFPAMAQDAKRRGIEIINASPISTITVFPKATVKELL